MQKHKYPVGIQTFEKIRKEGYLYIDKTDLVYDIAESYNYVFLSRPRRFGKSLLISTFKEYFSGNKELFAGLKIDSLEKDWIKYPVLHFNMSSLKRDSVKELELGIDFKLREYESLYEITSEGFPINDRFTNLIKTASRKTGQKVVILIDEYDAPLLNVLYEENMEEIRRTMRSFYSPIKDCDEYIKFAFMTGITKFSQLSIFSELNNLAKISMSNRFSAVCGITQRELETCMKDDIDALANELDLTYEETLSKLKAKYDGYHFSENSEDIYNPFSLLYCFSAGEIKNYWYDSGTPTFLAKSIKKFNFRISDTETLECPSTKFDVAATDLDSAIPLLYQAGYLTIKDYDKELETYRLYFPNNEVKFGLLDSLYPSVFPNLENAHGFYIADFYKDIRAGNVEAFMERLEAITLSVPYATGDKAPLITEQSVQNAFFLIFNLMGQYTKSEVHTLKGRSDCIVETRDTVYLFEFKLSKNGTAQEALSQIEDKNYACTYSPTNKKLVKIGVAFDTAKREFDQWLMK
ncbi:MAG: AAA family ATPase [Treponema sp.]|nr:AAA family ATPase [Candidatus Treponema equifaecale]